MKFSSLFASFLLFNAPLAFANPLVLECRFQEGRSVRLSMDELEARLPKSGNRCVTAAFNASEGTIPTRYVATLCTDEKAYGSVEVQNSTGSWFRVNEFSTEKNCELYRTISSKPAGGNGHNNRPNRPGCTPHRC